MLLQEIDLVHCRIQSIDALKLKRFKNLQVRLRSIVFRGKV